MKAVVTGCAGFLGSHLAQRILDDGGAVAGIDNLLTGSAAHVDLLGAYPRFAFTHADVAAAPAWDAQIRQHLSTIDVVFHLASPASPVDYARFPFETMAVNARGTAYALALAERAGARFVLASTSEIYGEPAEHPQRETSWGNVNPVGPRSCYDESKRFGETTASLYARMRNVDVRIARIFNTYGPRMRADDGRVIPSFITRALEGRPIVMEGDGSQTRAFTYVDDLIAGFIALARPEPLEHLVYNLGNPQETTIAQLATALEDVLGTALRIEHAPLPQDCPTRRTPDITRARTLGWEPNVALHGGLERTVQYFRRARAAAL